MTYLPPLTAGTPLVSHLGTYGLPVYAPGVLPADFSQEVWERLPIIVRNAYLDALTEEGDWRAFDKSRNVSPVAAEPECDWGGWRYGIPCQDHSEAAHTAWLARTGGRYGV